MSDPTALTLVEALQALHTKSLSARELTQAHLDAIEAANPVLNAYIHVCTERALTMADQSDARRASGDAGPLEGLPIGVKDLFCTKDVPTCAGSAILKGFVPPYESTVSANLWQAGAIMLGKLNLDEFAMGSSNETSIAGPVINPWRAKNDTAPRAPGGSSGGSAAAVAARLCLAAIGTDTGGSIRQPASLTGTVGVKPTYGRASRYGIVAFASSLDQAGPMTRNLADAALMLRTLCSHDDKDSTSIDAETPDWTQDVGRGVKGLKIGIPDQYRIDGMNTQSVALWEQGAQCLREAGAELIDVSLPHTRHALPAYYIIGPAEASSNLARYDGMRYGLRCAHDDLTETYETTRANGFGDEVKRRLLIGAYVLSAGYYDAYYLRAQKVRTRVAQDFKNVFADVDALLTPTTPESAFVLGDKIKDPVSMYMNDVFTATASLAGLPALSVPAGLDQQGLPLGLQVIGPALNERVCFQIGGVLEQSFGVAPTPDNWWSS